MIVHVKPWRLHALRGLYFISFIGLAPDVWTELATTDDVWDPTIGIAYSFWGAYSVLMLIGVLHPLKMLPLVFLQLFYKATWLLTIGLPLWRGGNMDAVAESLVVVCAIGVVLDLLLTPWKYVLHTFLKPRREAEVS